MRGNVQEQPTLLAMIDVEKLVPKKHPIRGIKRLADAALRELGAEFDGMYSQIGRPSIPPEQLLKSQLLIALFSVRSEEQFCEQLAYNFMFRWFLDMGLDGKVFDPTAFTHNRDRLIKHDVARKFFNLVVRQAKDAGLVSSEHFSVDGTLIEAWASLKSFKRKDGTSPPPDDDDKGNPTVNFHGEERSNDTHESTTDPEAKLMRKSNGTTAKLSYGAHGLMENRNGFLVDMELKPAVGVTEREAALDMLLRQATDEPLRRRTVGGDAGYDTRLFVGMARLLGFTPHIAATRDPRRRPATDARTRRHEGYELSQRKRKLIEEIWGWLKTIGGLRKTRYRGQQRVELHALFAGAAYNLLRMSRLQPT